MKIITFAVKLNIMKTYLSAVGAVLLLALALFSCKDPEVIWGDYTVNEGSKNLVVYSINNEIYSYTPSTDKIKKIITLEQWDLTSLNLSSDKTLILITAKVNSTNYIVYIIDVASGTIKESVPVATNYFLSGANVGFIGNSNEAYVATKHGCHFLNTPAGKYNYDFSSIDGGEVQSVTAFYIIPGTQYAKVYFRRNYVQKFVVDIPNNSSAHSPYKLTGDQYTITKLAKHGNKDVIFVYQETAETFISSKAVMTIDLKYVLNSNEYDYSSKVMSNKQNLQSYYGQFVFNVKDKQYYFLDKDNNGNVMLITPKAVKTTMDFDDPSQMRTIATYNGVNNYLIDMN